MKGLIGSDVRPLLEKLSMSADSPQIMTWGGSRTFEAWPSAPKKEKASVGLLRGSTLGLFMDENIGLERSISDQPSPPVRSRRQVPDIGTVCQYQQFVSGLENPCSPRPSEWPKTIPHIAQTTTLLQIPTRAHNFNHRTSSSSSSCIIFISQSRCTFPETTFRHQIRRT